MNLSRSLSAVVLFAAPVFAAPITFVGFLNSANEVPVNASTGTGFATVVFDDVARTLSVDVTFSGLTGLTTASHIHCCTPPGSNTIVATEVPSFSNLPIGVTSGAFTQFYNTSLVGTYNPAFVAANGGTADSAEAALFAGLMNGTAYLNLHTQFAKGGEIRADLVQTPEPGTFALIAVGTVGMMVLLRRATRTVERHS